MHFYIKEVMGFILMITLGMTLYALVVEPRGWHNILPYTLTPISLWACIYGACKFFEMLMTVLP